MRRPLSSSEKVAPLSTTMTSTATLSVDERQIILQRWKMNGVTSEEREEFVNRALSLLADDKQLKAFADNISNVAQLALDIYKTFDEVLMWWLNPSLIGEWGELKFVSCTISMSFLLMMLTGIRFCL